MEDPPDPVAAKLTHHGTPVRARTRLDGCTDIPKPRAGTNRSDPGCERLVHRVNQPPRSRLDRSDGVHARGVAIPAIENYGDIDIQDVAVPQPLLSRYAVADHVVDRNAGCLRIAAIAKWRRNRPVVADVLLAESVDVFRQGSGTNFRPDGVQALRGQDAPQPALRRNPMHRESRSVPASVSAFNLLRHSRKPQRLRQRNRVRTNPAEPAVHFNARRKRRVGGRRIGRIDVPSDGEPVAVLPLHHI